MELQGSRLGKHRQRAQILRLSDDAAVTYLLIRHAAIFKLEIKLTDKMYHETKWDGSFGYSLQSRFLVRLLFGARIGRME